MNATLTRTGTATIAAATAARPSPGDKKSNATRITARTRRGTPLLLIDPVVLGHRFQRWLTGRM